MAKSTKKREIKTVKKTADAPAPVREAELAPDATPIKFPKTATEQPPVYRMICWAGEYEADSWIGLGWAIFTHRLWHLWHDGSFKD